jgi:hypothetical protein
VGEPVLAEEHGAGSIRVFVDLDLRPNRPLKKSAEKLLVFVVVA